MSQLSTDYQQITQQDRIVVVLGPFGSGKSSFIECAIGQHGQIVGHGLQSYMTDIQTFRTTHPIDGQPVVFIDTPGFDDKCRSVTETLGMIAHWLAKNYSANFKLSTVVYLHRISDNRMGGSALRNLQILTSLCSQQAILDVIIATTMWSDVREETGARREEELKEYFWNEMLGNGCRTERFEDTYESAWRIIGSLAGSVQPQAAISPADHIVVVMGATGSGKSTFIATASRQGRTAIRHGLWTAASDIRTVKAIHPQNGESVVFVDTPGFDVTSKSDTETLYQIADWLVETNKQNANLTISIVYLHRISDNRMATILQQSLRLFVTLCGQKVGPNITIATTMWSEVRGESGARREVELKELSKDFLASGCKIARFEDTYDSAWDIIGINSGTSLLLRSALGDVGKALEETTAYDVILKDGLPKWLTEFLKRTIRRNHSRT